MNLLRNLFSSLVTFFLVPAIFIFIFLSSTTSVFLDTSKFNSVLKETKVYSNIGSLLTPLLTNQNSTLQPDFLKQVLTAKAEQLQSDTEKIVISVHHYLTTDEKNFETKINLAPYHQVVKELVLKEITNNYKNLPVCTAQLLNLFQNFDFPVCQKPGVSLTDWLKTVSVDKLVTEIVPNFLIINEKGVSTDPSFNLITNIPQGGTRSTNQTNQEPTLSHAKTTIATLRQGQDLLLVAILSLVILLAVSRFKHYSDSLFWISTTLFSASLFPLILSFATIYFLKPDLIQKTLQKILSSDPTASPLLLSLLTNTTFAFTNNIMEKVKIEALVLIILTVVLFITSKYLDFRKSRKVSLDAASKKVT